MVARPDAVSRSLWPGVVFARQFETTPSIVGQRSLSHARFGRTAYFVGHLFRRLSGPACAYGVVFVMSSAERQALALRAISTEV